VRILLFSDGLVSAGVTGRTIGATRHLGFGLGGGAVGDLELAGENEEAFMIP
jgi:hypothetical protein